MQIPRSTTIFDRATKKMIGLLVIFKAIHVIETDQGGYLWVEGGRGGHLKSPKESRGRLRDLMEIKQCFLTSTGKLIVP